MVWVARHLGGVQLVIDNRARLVGDVPAEVGEAIQAEWTRPNPDWMKAKVFGFRGKIQKYLVAWERSVLSGGRWEWSVPRGSADRLVALVADQGLKIREVHDLREVGPVVKWPTHRKQPWDFQEELIRGGIDRITTNRGGVDLWRSPPASGKTTASLEMACRLGVRTLVIVASTALQTQWARRVRVDLGIEPGLLGGKKTRIPPGVPIVIGMQQSLRTAAKKLRGEFGFVIADEVQTFAASTFQAVIDELAARYRLGVSGDERRADKKEFLIYDQFGPVGAEIQHEEMVRRGFVHEVQVRVVPTAFKCGWYQAIGEEEGFEDETPEQRRIRIVQAKVAAHDQLLDAIGADPDRMALTVEVVREAVAEAGQVIALASRREHCHRIDAAVIEAGLRSGLLIGGEDYRDAFVATLQGFQAGEIQAAVGTYQAIGVGFDLPQVPRGICVAPVANSADGDKQWRQYRGRFARTADGKQDAAVYYLLDVEVFGTRPLRNLVRWNHDVVVRSGDEWIKATEWLRQRKQDQANAQTQRQPEPPDPAGGTSGGPARRKRSEAGSPRTA